MSGIFRPAFRMPQQVQSSHGVLSAVGGGAIAPAHVASAGATFAPALIRSASAALFGNGQGFETLAVRVTLKPIAIGSSSAYFDTAVDAGGGVAPALFANGSSFAALRLTLRLSPAVYANAAMVFSPIAEPAGAKRAPLVVSGGMIHAPRVERVHAPEVVGTLSVTGWAPRRAARRPLVATWPNLPKAEAPAWRLTVVTPEVARARARSLMAHRRRTEQVRRTREAKRKQQHQFDEIVELEIAHTLVRLVGEEA